MTMGDSIVSVLVFLVIVVTPVVLCVLAPALDGRRTHSRSRRAEQIERLERYRLESRMGESTERGRTPRQLSSRAAANHPLFDRDLDG